MNNLVKLQKQVNLAQSFLNFATNNHGGDKELMAKLAGLHIEEINSIVLKLLSIDKNKINEEIYRSVDWITFLKEIKEKIKL